ncbi:MAG: hypothetical protein C0506_13060 [Anaerolinea sp.]|nr:hypothetical protein [Anaerolinea sp.]
MPKLHPVHRATVIRTVLGGTVVAAVLVFLSQSGLRTSALAEPGVYDGATLQEAQQVLLAFRTISGEPIPPDVGRFPREVGDQVRFAADRCAKVDTLASPSVPDVAALQFALVDSCSRLLRLPGVKEPGPTTAGEPHRPSAIDSDPSVLPIIVAEAASAKVRLSPLVDRAQAALSKKASR